MIHLKNNILNSILQDKFNTPFNSIPFNKIILSEFIPSIKSEIKKTLKVIKSICYQSYEASFENTIEPLSLCGEQLELISSILFNINSAETNLEIQKITQEAAPLLTKFNNDVRLNKKLFLRIQKINAADKSHLTQEQITLLKKEYKSFVRNGALLNDEEKKILRLLDQKMATLSLNFGVNVLSDTQSFNLQITDKKNLNGLPNSSIELAMETAKSLKKNGWVFTLDYPSYIPFMKYCQNRSLRKKMSIAFGKRGFKKNKNNNEKIIFQIIRYRKERAFLLGYKSHAEFILEERMAKSEKNVISFLDDLKQKILPFAKKEWNDLVEFSKNKLKIQNIQKWDIVFVSERMRESLFKIDDEFLKSYFPLEQVLKGVFEITKKLYGLKFKLNKIIETYHETVSCYEVYNEKEHFYALLYTDFHPRPGKRSGAWMTSFLPQKNKQRPHVSIVCNFSPPTEKKPSLLSFQEVTTLFHEFGHALHGILANTNYSALSGTSVFWDFVELPSQIMENWCYQSDALNIFAKHYKTQELISEETIEKIKNAAYFQKGLETIRQLSYSYLDISLHGKSFEKINSIKNHEIKVLSDLSFTPDVYNNCISTSFSHIFQGGYSAGYYSYKWAEVLDADAFELFLEKGIFDKKTAKSFHDNILSMGGTNHPMKLYEKFRGKPPDPNALLKRSGLLMKQE